MSENSLPTTLALPVATAADGSEVVRAESFLVWKQSLLWQVRLADIGVKMFLILLLPLTIFFSFYYVLLFSPRPTVWQESVWLIVILIVISIY